VRTEEGGVRTRYSSFSVLSTQSSALFTVIAPNEDS
jgi:hypothetical protein